MCVWKTRFLHWKNHEHPKISWGAKSILTKLHYESAIYEEYFMAMYFNAGLHRAYAVKDYFKESDIEIMKFPEFSQTWMPSKVPGMSCFGCFTRTDEITATSKACVQPFKTIRSWSLWSACIISSYLYQHVATLSSSLKEKKFHTGYCLWGFPGKFLLCPYFCVTISNTASR